ncbi:transglutaminase-like domain-containing protein [Stenotrophomonas mori]|uniref:Transglutaminase domain-containing protein n=1 Tax=Stenotrophomonas mori TaxID=2871096 RepID=A0ABT0SJI8_9GAMM|nr:transglutaminase domain-containing protein [Stenotrophomonas mori]MCL7715501.1 transglutaminase domain-containing protein [Stenotrophomonas mori]
MAGLLCFLSTVAVAADGLPEVTARVDRGDFAGAQAQIDAALQQPALTEAQREGYRFQRERMRRMRMDFALDREQAMAAVKRYIPDLRDDEFRAWDDAGLIEHLDIDGERRWFTRAPSNLFRVSDAAVARRAPSIAPPAPGPFEVVTPHHVEVLKAAQATGATSVAPRRIRVTQSLRVKADAVPAGETVRAWIPYPRAIAGQQEDIRWLGSVPEGAQVAPEATLQRTAYLERTAVAGTPTEFSVSYEVTVYARHIAIDPDAVQPTPQDPALAPYLAERAPHVVFTPALREFSRRVVGSETDPYRIARKLFDAVDRIPWGGAREYSTISNISDYALHADHADCGQQTLLLISLLRLNGIPARWQSGMVYSDDAVGYSNLHDWGALYLAPYGWVPMDVTTGALDSPIPAVRDFYLGGLDAYRIAFNDDYAQPLVPAKRHFRSETVDSQRGEAEWSGGNLYFDQWDYDFQWQVLRLPER